MKKQNRVLVIGGGASGMMSAIVAARHGAAVTLVERMPRVGKKLMATGAGQCNLCNVKPARDHYHGADTEFILPALESFGAEPTLAFFDELGVEVRDVGRGRIFPITGQASNVLDLLRYEVDVLGVNEVTDVKIQKVCPSAGGLRCVGVEDEAFDVDKVIIAAGGESSPNLGSNGGGYKISRALGHRVTRTFPSLVPLNLSAWFLKRLKGVKVRDAGVAACVDGKALLRSTGDLLFAEYGISGPPVLDVSRVIGEHEDSNRSLSVSLDLFPELSEDDLAAMIWKRIAYSPDKTLDICFIGLFHKRLIPVVLKEAGEDDLSQRCEELGEKSIQRIAALLKCWNVRCTGTRSWMNSQVTAGGVDVSQVNADTLESRLVPGIYFVGEVLDIDGDCGGYNLQWAWSSGYVAGKHAAESS